MHEADMAFAVDDGVHGHTSELEQVDFLLVNLRYSFAHIGQSDKRKLILTPIIDKGRGLVGADSQNFGSTRGEIFVAISQARQLRAAIRSHEAAQEGQQNNLLTTIG